MWSRTKSIATLAIALTLPVAACDEGPEFGTMTIHLTDDPSETIVEAWVTITDIYLQGEGGEEDPQNGRVYLLQNADETHELLSLANDVETLVLGAELPTGSYGQLRMAMSGGCIRTEDGGVFATPGYGECGAATGSLQMPSFAESGAKVLLHGLHVTGGQQILLLDFMVEDSYGRLAGASGTWVMHPVIQGSEIQLTGGIEVTLSAGDVALPDGFELGDFSATLDPETGDPSEVPFTDEDGDGTFEVSFLYLIPGNGPFEVSLNAPDGLTVEVDPATPQLISLASGESPTVAWVLQSAVEE